MIFLEESFSEGEYRSLWSLFSEGAISVSEARAFCATGEGNGIDNSCSSADGGAATAVAEAIQSAPKAASPPGPRIWTPGQPTGDVTARVLASPPTVRTDDGKGIASTTIPDAHTYPFAGKEWVSTIDVGAHLSAMQDEARGGMINTATGRGKSLSRDDFEYIASAITDQATSAASRGVTPMFYSPEELDRQLEEFSSLVPQVRGGRTKDGVLIEREDAEHLFRVVQALTSPNASPFINMQRTDSLLRKFFDGDGRITTSDSLGVTGPGIRKSLSRFQRIVDTLGKRTDGSVDVAAGLKAARELLQHQMLPTRDVERFFSDFASKGDKKGAWKPNSYLMGEVVPVFSTFGPKVGPFYENNQGNHDPLTADVWFTRTWGRVTGELVVPGKPEKSVEKAKSLLKVFKDASEEHYHGIEPSELEDSIRRTVETGAVDDVLRAWSADRLRHFASGDYKEKSGVGGRLNRLAKNIVENDTSLMGDPGAGSRRSNMIKVMREAAARTGMPVAYLQDVLWQDEQDAYAAAGAKTATNVGQLSLYSDQIRRIAQNQESNRRPMAKKEKRSADPSAEEFYDDYARGGREQMLWEEALANVDDQEFADAVIALADGSRRPMGGLRASVALSRRAFCPTGEDGGIDNSCGGKEGGSPGGDKPSGGSPKTYTPDPTSDKDGDGVTDAARVGVPAFDVPPPPKIGRLPGLDKHESAVEDAFIKHYEADPDKVSSQFLEVVTKSGEPPTFGTDDAKCLTDAWSDPDPERRAESRATLNCALHQTANAIAKRSFLQHLDTLDKGDEIMVTVGGCGAGKGFALKHDPVALEAKGRAKAVWDSAGDQNATENPWILKEAEARGLKVTFVYVHADPKTQWADPNRGVVKRAADPKDGRMVDAKVFADSYAIGARNHHAFHQANKENPSARFIFLDNTGKPKQIDGVPQSARDLDADELASFAAKAVQDADVPPRVKKGGTIGERIWGGKKK